MEPPKINESGTSAAGSSKKATENVEQLAQRLAEENRVLLHKVNILSVQQAFVSHRLQNVEQSIVFRFLRWIGGKFLDSPSWVQRLLPLRRFIDVAPRLTYAAWIRESETMESIAKLDETSPRRASDSLISVVTIGSQAGTDDPSFASIARQTYSLRETHFASVSGIVEKPDDLLEKLRGEYVTFIPPGVVLDPRAFECWIAGAANDADLIYSDWDHINPAGDRHSPRFTPEFSSWLLTETLYFGHAFLVRTAALRAMLPQLADELRSIPGITDDEFLWSLARRVSSLRSNVVRIPMILWHQAGESASIETSGNTSRAISDRKRAASLIICSRSPKQIRRSLEALRPTLGTETEVILVAHAAGDLTELSRVAEEFGAKTVPYHGAFHFGLMNGLGVRAASRDVVVLLNDDVFPLHDDWLARMIATAQAPDAGVVGSLLYYPSGRIQHAGVVVGQLSGPTHVGHHLRDSVLWPWLTMTREVSAVTGACMAMRREVWDELGGFDPRFPVNYNDIDLCLRAAKLGYRTILEARATLTHEESQTRRGGVSAEELALFASVWSAVIEQPDPYFHPALLWAERNILLRSPWSRLH